MRSEIDALGRALRGVLGAAGALGLLTLALSCARRVGSPYPLEWMEGASVQHALWLARGELPYAAPSAELISYLYPPLAYMPMALASALFGPSLPVARAVSLACTLGTLALIGRASARLAGERVAGVLGAGLFACGFGYGGAFLDLARVDACFVLCVAAAAERLSAQRTAPALYWLAASALAKQHGALLLLAVSLAVLFRERAPEVRAAVVRAWLALLGACALLQLASDGWFARYVLEVPGRHGLTPALLASFLAIDLGVYLPVLSIGAALALASRRRALTALDALLLAAVAVSALGRAHPGGDDNVRLPALALLCIAGVPPIARKLLQSSRTARELGTAPGRAARVGLALALCLQLAILWQPPSAHAPSAESARRFAALEAELARCARGGRAVALDHARLTGVPFLHTMALSDLRLGGDTPIAHAGTRALLDALRGPDAPAAIAVGERFPELEAVLAQRYTPCAELPAPRLPTGYQPGARAPHGELRQEVFARRAP